MNYLAALLLSFVAVTLKALQQRHVGAAEYLKMPAVSYGMATCDVLGMYCVFKTADDVLAIFLLIVAFGTGGALGSILGTWLHARNH